VVAILRSRFFKQKTFPVIGKLLLPTIITEERRLQKTSMVATTVFTAVFINEAFGV